MKSLRVLIVEDSEPDAALLLRELQKTGYSAAHRRVENAEEMADALDTEPWDIIISDHSMPSFSSLEALRILRNKGIDIPFIIVSGQIGEDVAVEAMREGAHDYIMKSNLKRLGPAIKRELAQAESRKMRRLAEEDLRRSASELRALAHRLLQVQEEERLNIARELHDEIGQQLTMLKLIEDKDIRAMGEQAPPGLLTAREMTAALLEEVRSLSLRLRPGTLDELGLLPTLETHLKDFTEKTHIEVDFQHSGLERELGQAVRTGAYRIIQEALTNIIRHAGASRVAIRVELNGKTLEIRIKDNGAGFDPSAVAVTSSGLRGMRERAQYLGGTFNLESNPEKGTKITVKLPLDGEVTDG